MISARLKPDPNATAFQLTGRTYVSFSALRTYATCPLRYFFKYIQGLPEKTVSASLAFGSGIHAAAELWFNDLMSGNKLPDQDQLLAAFWETWREKGKEATILFGKGEDVNTLGDLAGRVLTSFRQSEFAHPDGHVIGVEEELRGCLVPGVPDLLARLDLIVETKESLIVTDLKTARSRWSSGQAQDQAEQLLLYSELAKQLAPAKSLRLEFAVITKAKAPTAEQFPIDIIKQRVERTKQIMERVWRAIESRNFYPAPSALNCPSCPFRGQCRAWPG